MMKRRVWVEVQTCGDSWKVVKSVLIFIYAPVISISLVCKLSTQKWNYLARYPPSHC